MITRARSRRRRLVVQLAALVDLLFVVMFMQYTQLQQSAAQERELRAQAQSVSRDASALKNEALNNLNELTSERDELKRQNEKLLEETAALQGRKDEIERAAEVQLREIAAAAKELLSGVDPAAVSTIMAGASDRQRAAVLKSLDEAQGQNIAAMVQSLRTAAELRKRCDIWEVHINPDNSVRIKPPEGEPRVVRLHGADDFTQQFLALTKEFREPQSLVLILLTHGNASVGTIEAVQKGLEQVRTVWRSELVRRTLDIQLTVPAYSSDSP